MNATRVAFTLARHLYPFPVAFGCRKGSASCRRERSKHLMIRDRIDRKGHRPKEEPLLDCKKDRRHHVDHVQGGEVQPIPAHPQGPQAQHMHPQAWLRASWRPLTSPSSARSTRAKSSRSSTSTECPADMTNPTSLSLKLVSRVISFASLM